MPACCGHYSQNADGHPQPDSSHGKPLESFINTHGSQRLISCCSPTEWSPRRLGTCVEPRVPPKHPKGLFAEDAGLGPSLYNGVNDTRQCWQTTFLQSDLSRGVYGKELGQEVATRVECASDDTNQNRARGNACALGLHP